jgi:hypothetical protein
MSNERTVLDVLVDLSQPLPLDPPWDFLREVPACRRFVHSPDELLVRLRQRCSDEDLRASRLFVADAGQLAWAAPFVPWEPEFLVLRSGAGDEETRELATRAGCRSGVSALQAFRQDTQLQTALTEREPVIYAVSSLAEIALLRSLGLPAWPLCLLARLNYRELRDLWNFVRRDCSPSNQNQASHAPILYLVAGSLIGINAERPAELTSVAERIDGLIEHLGFRGPRDIKIWWPNPAELAGLAYRMNLREPQLLQQFFRRTNWFTYDVHSFVEGKTPRRRSPSPSILIALNRILEHPRRETAHVNHRREALGEFRRHLERDLVRPLLEEALAVPDPRRRALAFQLGNTFRELLALMPEIHTIRWGDAFEMMANPEGVTQQTTQWECLESLTNQVVRLITLLQREGQHRWP